MKNYTFNLGMAVDTALNIYGKRGIRTTVIVFVYRLDY